MANQKISELAAATSVTDDDVVPIVQGGVNVQATLAQLLTVGRQALAYGTTVAVVPGSGRYMVLTVTDGVGFTLSNPTTATDGQEIEFKVVNSSGGAMGVITWGGQYKRDASWANPASTKSKTIRFGYDGTNWIQSGAPSGDI